MDHVHHFIASTYNSLIKGVSFLLSSRKLVSSNETKQVDSSVHRCMWKGTYCEHKEGGDCKEKPASDANDLRRGNIRIILLCCSFMLSLPHCGKGTALNLDAIKVQQIKLLLWTKSLWWKQISRAVHYFGGFWSFNETKR